MAMSAKPIPQAETGLLKEQRQRRKKTILVAEKPEAVLKT
jgi:hypothetical protein